MSGAVDPESSDVTTVAILILLAPVKPVVKSEINFLS